MRLRSPPNLSTSSATLAAVADDGRVNSRDVRDYYERNDGLFRRFGSTTQAGSIHRALWAPGVGTLDAALNHAHALVLAQLRALAPEPVRPVVADLGCGRGGALRYLAAHSARPLRAFGVTLSPAQARHAKRIAPQACVVEGDYLHLPFAPALEFACAIESFIHAPGPQACFAALRRAMRPGARLVLIDDMLEGEPAPGADARCVEAFRRGWHAPGLHTQDAWRAQAAAHGFSVTHALDLTPWLKLRALPRTLGDLALRLARPLLGRSDVLDASIGSIALQQMLAGGLSRYRMLVFDHDR